MAKNYKCPYCNEHLSREDLVQHIDEDHDDMIPENFSPSRVVFDIVNNKQGKGGVCVVCKRETPWDENAQKYKRLCGRPQCNEKLREAYKKNMLKVHGKITLLNDPEHQEKMLANRGISGKYKFKDGGYHVYTGSYELKALEFLDALGYKSSDILSPGPTLDYEYKGESHKWITDIMLIPYNLIIEVKDGGDNVNNRINDDSRDKTIAKEIAVTKLGKYNYLRLTNNDFQQLLETLMELKAQMIDDSEDNRKVVININEEVEALKDMAIYYIKEGGDDMNILFNGNDIYVRVEDFKAKKIPVLFITGMSGGGKTTLAKKFVEEQKCAYVEIDAFANCRYMPENDHPWLFEYLKSIGKDTDEKIDDYGQELQDMTPAQFGVARAKYLKWVIDKASNSNQVVIEGVQIPTLYKDYKSTLFTKYALIIKGTSLLVSFLRRIKRDKKEFISNLPYYIGRYIDWYESQNKFRNDILKESSKHEETSNRNIIPIRSDDSSHLLAINSHLFNTLKINMPVAALCTAISKSLSSAGILLGTSVMTMLSQMHHIDFVKLNDKTFSSSVGDDYLIDGEPVYACNSGRVAYANTSEGNSLINPVGCFVVIEHNGFYSLYAHLKKNSICVKQNDLVKRGDKIGSVGSTGNSSEPHLHFGLSYTNPKYMKYLSGMGGVCKNIDGVEDYRGVTISDNSFNTITKLITLDSFESLSKYKNESFVDNHSGKIFDLGFIKTKPMYKSLKESDSVKGNHRYFNMDDVEKYKPPINEEEYGLILNDSGSLVLESSGDDTKSSIMNRIHRNPEYKKKVKDKSKTEKEELDKKILSYIGIAIGKAKSQYKITTESPLFYLLVVALCLTGLGIVPVAAFGIIKMASKYRGVMNYRKELYDYNFNLVLRSLEKEEYKILQRGYRWRSEESNKSKSDFLADYKETHVELNMFLIKHVYKEEEKPKVRAALKKLLSELNKTLSKKYKQSNLTCVHAKVGTKKETKFEEADYCYIYLVDHSKEYLDESSIEEFGGPGGMAGTADLSFVTQYGYKNSSNDEVEGYAVHNDVVTDSIITVSKKGKVKKESSDFLKGRKLRVFQFVGETGGINKIINSIGKRAYKEFIYEALTGKQLLSDDQILCDKCFEEVSPSNIIASRNSTIQTIFDEYREITGDPVMKFPIMNHRSIREMESLIAGNENIKVFENQNGYFAENTVTGKRTGYYKDIKSIQIGVIS